ncbi:MAG: DNA methyltransferase [Thiopseudomonas sp.]
MSSTQQEKAKLRRAKFAALLRDMFQLDRPELDFGLYRIMHAKKDDINRFIDEDLPKLAQDAFKDFAGQDKSQLEQAIKEARQAAITVGVNPDDAPKVKELEAQYNSGFDTAREEGEVYDALVTFFSRYYDEGDFISQRRYGDGTYAIPYQGEEVVLHWANKDQYYIKSSDTLRDYTLKLNPSATAGEDPLRVHFKLVDATAGAKDNNKETDDNKRQFILDAEQPFEFITGEPDAGGKRYQELVCRFEFRPVIMDDWEDTNTRRSYLKSTKAKTAEKTLPNQEQLINVAEELLLGDGSELAEQWKSALSKPYQKANGELADYSTLKGQLNNYTQKNNFDYFIHKDLGGFLTRELDFYIKNELMQWEDLAALKNNPARLAPMLSKLDVIRDLGGKIITFLAQLENFQKKLWLKKKFVTETNYCITLDRVPEALYPEICGNQAQLEEWIKLFAIDEIKGDLTTPAFSNPLTLEFLQANQNLVLDTQFFSEQFKAELVASIEDFDEQCDGLLISSENFQALNVIQEKYSKSIDGIYIDPPYNSDGMEIIYKNNYKDSSWCSLINNRLSIAKTLLTDSAVTCTTIDEAEVSNLDMLLKKTFDNCTVRPVVIEYNHRGRVKSNFAITHEYALWTIPKGKDLVTRQKEVSDAIRRNLRRTGTDSRRIDSPNQFYGIEVDNESLKIISVTPPLAVNEQIPANYNNDTTMVWPIDDYGVERRWYYGRERVIKEAPEGTVWATKIKDKIQIHYHQDGKPKMRKSVWVGKKLDASTYGSELLNSIFGLGKVEFSFPKSIHAVEQCIESLSESKKATFLDYFSGSGTTGHAVINLNRKDSGNRKYILVEMGSYFDAVTKPRMAKVVYASDWKNGKPESRDTGISHCFKYIRLESYEDTLGNLTLNTKQDLFSQASNDDARQAYVMNYMLDVETRGSQSLLNIEQFTNPTEYQLNVRSASGDETVPVKVDLLETFNYLLGLEVEHIAAPMHFDAEITTGEYGRKQAKVKHTTEGKWWFRTVYGKNRNGQYVLVVWRNLPSVIEAGSDAEKRTEALITDNAVLDAVLVERLKIRLTESLDDEIDILYVNGDNNIAIPRDRQGNPMEQARVQLIEDAFKRLMFADTDAVH